MHVQIYPDCSGSMGKVNPRKGAYAVAVAAAIGYLAIHNMDKVSYHLVRGTGRKIRSVPSLGKNAFFRAMNTLDQTEFADEAEISPAIVSTPDMGTGDGMTVIISDFYSDRDWKKGVDYLVYKKKRVLLIVYTPRTSWTRHIPTGLT